jgi:hypothetical protein
MEAVAWVRPACESYPELHSTGNLDVRDRDIDCRMFPKNSGEPNWTLEHPISEDRCTRDRQW